MKVEITKKEWRKIADDVLWSYFSIDLNDLLKWAKQQKGRTIPRPFLQQYLNERYPENLKRQERPVK